MTFNSSLKEDSVLASLIVYMQRICENNEGNRLRMSIAFKVELIFSFKCVLKFNILLNVEVLFEELNV
jgi:hypothetical protein